MPVDKIKDDSLPKSDIEHPDYELNSGRIKDYPKVATIKPVSADIEQEAEKAANDYVKRQGSVDKPDIIKHDFLAGWEAKTQSLTVSNGVLEELGEKEVMIQAFDKVRELFEMRSWIMDGRGSYPYNDDKYKQEVRFLYDEFDALKSDVWKNIKTKTFEYREKIIAEYLKNQVSNGVEAIDRKLYIDDVQAWVKMYTDKQITIGKLTEILNENK